ncbi:MAG: PrgI family protein [Patescibacteria group bacterium]
MRFQVPQFIEVEDKIFGPLTFKQFIYLAGGAGLVTILWSLLPSILAVPLAIPVIVVSVALAFYRVNGKPFIHLMESFFSYVTGSRLYIWKKIPKIVPQEAEKKENVSLFVPKLSDSKLRDLTWSLGIKENSNPVTLGSSWKESRGTRQEEKKKKV